MEDGRWDWCVCTYMCVRPTCVCMRTLCASLTHPLTHPRKHPTTTHQDIEYAVEAALEALFRPGCSGAFAHDVGGEETVAYVAELRNATTDKQLLQEAVDEVRRVVAQEFQVWFRPFGL